jgi:hypothetical protein
MSSTPRGEMTLTARSRPWRGLRTTLTGLVVASPHSIATVNMDCSNTIALRIASRPTPFACISPRHAATIRGVMSPSAASPNRTSIRRPHVPS